MSEQKSAVERLVDAWDATPDNSSTDYDCGRVDQRHAMTMQLLEAIEADKARAEEVAPEWEYGLRLQQTYKPRPGENAAASPFMTPTMPQRTLEGARRVADLNPSYSPTYFRRVKAGPWVPVKQEGADNADPR